MIRTIAAMFFLLTTIQGAYAGRAVYYPKSRTVDFKYEGIKHSITLDHVGQDSLWTDEDPAPAFNDPKSRSLNWTQLWNETLGVSNGTRSGAFDQAAQQIYDIAQSKNYDSTKLLMLTYAFIEHLGKTADLDQVRGAFFVPELLYRGPTSPYESTLLTAALLSSLCFDVEMILLHSGWQLAVAADASVSGQKYVIDGLPYKLMEIGRFRPAWNPRDHAYIAPTVNIEEMCSVQNHSSELVRHEEPIKETPRAFAGMPEAYASLRVSMRSLEGSEWIASADRAIRSARIGAVVERGVIYARERDTAPSDNISYEWVSRDVSGGPQKMESGPGLIVFGEKQGAFVLKTAKRIAR